MKIYLAASETQAFIDYAKKHTELIPYNHLFSYFYTRQKTKLQNYLTLQPRIQNVLIDSGAHTFHTAQNANFTDYTLAYADFIKKTDKPNVQGYFEMDIDNRIGFKNVLKLRRILEEFTDKIIPVWHKNRGFKKYRKMCRNYNYVSISCLPKFILNHVPFDSVDSASWMFSAVNGRFNSKRIKRGSISNEEKVILSFLDWRRKQLFYEKYWRFKKNKESNLNG